VGAIKRGEQDKLYLGNLKAKRDWGHAWDYVEGMWLMLQQDKPDDYVLATGHTRTVRQFVEAAFAHAELPLVWNGDIGMIGNRAVVQIDPIYYRPLEVDTLIGDASKAREVLGWAPKISFDQMVKEMIEHDSAVLS